MIKITSYIIGNRTFIICKDARGYWGIEDKYLNNGILSVALNGISGCLGHTIPETIAAINARVQFDALQEQGFSLEEIAAMMLRT